MTIVKESTYALTKGKKDDDLVDIYRSISVEEGAEFVKELVAGYHHMDMAVPSYLGLNRTTKES